MGGIMSPLVGLGGTTNGATGNSDCGRTTIRCRHLRGNAAQATGVKCCNLVTLML